MGPDLYVVGDLGEGFLAVMAKPVAGEWLGEDLRALKSRGVIKVVSLLEQAEQFEVGLGQEASICASAGLAYQSYPIPDRGLPSSIPEFRSFVRSLYSEICAGQSTVVHCRAGIGRSGLVAASVLVEGGHAVDEAFDMISRSRGVNVPDTDEQRRFVATLQGGTAT